MSHKLLRLLYSIKLWITIGGERKTFHGKAKYKLYLLTNSATQQGLEGKFQPDKANQIQKHTEINNPRQANKNKSKNPTPQ